MGRSKNLLPIFLKKFKWNLNELGLKNKAFISGDENEQIFFK